MGFLDYQRAFPLTSGVSGVNNTCIMGELSTATVKSNGRRGPEAVVFRRVYEDLSRRIEQMSTAAAEALPSELKLCEEYGCSRVTIRRVLGALAREGRVCRRAGKGTFAADRRLEKRSEAARIVWHVSVEFLGYASGGNDFCRELLSALRRHAGAEGSGLSLSGDLDRAMPRDPKGFASWARTVGAEVVVAWPEEPGGADLAACAKSGVPIVLFARRSSGRELDSVSVDHYGSFTRAMDLLAGLGHRRIAYIGTAGHDEPTRARWEAYESGLAAHGLERLAEPCADPRFGTIHGQTLSALERGPTAIITGGYAYNWAVCQALAAVGRRIPRDVSLLAVDEFAEAAHCDPPISVIRQPLGLMVEQALNLARERVRNPGRAAREILLDAEIVLRQSVGQPRE